MVGGSGQPTAPAVNRHTCTAWRPLLIALIGLVGASACVYFNAVYNANRLFDEGRSDIANGRVATGEASLATSIQKAERVVADNPDSRWADDALRLIVRARLLLEEWPEALAAAERLMTYASSARDSAEVAGYMGLAEVDLDRAARADSLLSTALELVHDDEFRARLLHGRGRARGQLGRVDAANSDLREAVALDPDWLDPRIDRIRLLVTEDRDAEAVAAIRQLLQGDFRSFEERRVMETVEFMAEHAPSATAEALARAEESELTAANRARLVTLRGDLHAATGDTATARADYQAAISVAPGSPGAVTAQLAIVRMRFAALSTIADIYQIKATLDEINRSRAARGSPELRELRDRFERLQFWVESGNLGYLLAAEVARDDLGALRLARELFVRYVDQQPQSAWAPKALLAAVALDDLHSGPEPVWPDQPETAELRRRLLEDYPESPYVNAVTGESGSVRFSYEDLEEGLRRQLQRLKRLTEDRLRERGANNRLP